MQSLGGMQGDSRGIQLSPQENSSGSDGPARCAAGSVCLHRTSCRDIAEVEVWIGPGAPFDEDVGADVLGCPGDPVDQAQGSRLLYTYAQMGKTLISP